MPGGPEGPSRGIVLETLKLKKKHSGEGLRLNVFGGGLLVTILLSKATLQVPGGPKASLEDDFGGLEGKENPASVKNSFLINMF